MLKRSLFLLIFSIVVVRELSAQKRAITAADCVTVRDMQFDETTFRSTIKISPDGSRVAYPVRSPNLTTNANEIGLYVRKLPTDPANAGKAILAGDIKAMRWRPDSRTLTVLMKENGRRMLEEVDPDNGAHRVLVKADLDIEEYSISEDGGTIVYGTKAPAQENAGRTAEQMASGYRIAYERSEGDIQRRETLFVTRRTESGWTPPEPITVTSPLSQQPLTSLAFGNAPDLNPVLSADGKALLVTYFDDSPNMPEEWRNSGYMQFRNTAGIVQEMHLLVLYDLTTRKTTVPLKTPWVIYTPHWSADGKSFAAVARPPINSELEQQNIKLNLMGTSRGAHLFVVDLGTGKVEDVAAKLANPYEGPLYWDKNGDLFVRVTSIKTISRFSRANGKWQQTASWQLPLPRIGTHVATDGNYVIGDFNDTTTPPELFIYRPGEKQVKVFAKLNPQFETLTLAQPQIVHWNTSTGFHASGLLLLPPNYVKGNRYPLVIHTKPFGTFFACSAGDFPSFAPQPIANAGMMYLATIAEEGFTQNPADYYPKGYPGGQGVGSIAEAAFAMDLWDNAVRALDAQGLIDASRVGIIGFSRTGWYTEFILTHSNIPYRAATVTDNVQYSLGEYWIFHNASFIKTSDLTYGGPPYGPTLENWLRYSISFNIDKIHAPLLMEQMGYGQPYNESEVVPITLAPAFEVFTGLNRLNKPVELYYYPNEEHTPEHPKARLATMQRNVDWYRFWLKDEEDADPAKAEQYRRWRELRKLHAEDEKRSATTKPASR